MIIYIWRRVICSLKFDAERLPKHFSILFFSFLFIYVFTYRLQ